MRGGVGEAPACSAPDALAALVRFNPEVARLAAAAEVHPLRRLDRAAPPGGVGWSQLFVALTARCNERCGHCYAESSPEREEALSRDLRVGRFAAHSRLTAMKRCQQSRQR